MSFYLLRVAPSAAILQTKPGFYPRMSDEGRLQVRGVGV
jgi:hypothetical protein